MYQSPTCLICVEIRSNPRRSIQILSKHSQSLRFDVRYATISAAMFLRNKWINTFQLSLYLDKWIKTHSEVSLSIQETRKHDARVWRWNCHAEMIASSVFYLWRSFLHFPRHQKAPKILSGLQHCKILCRYSWF